MRTEQLSEAKVLAYVYGPSVTVQVIESDDPETVDRESKAFYHKTVSYLNFTQRNHENSVDGFILYRGVVYKVPKNGSNVIKLTGDAARDIKRLVKKQEPVPYKKAA